ncbi:Putative glycoside hydrolase family 16, concanavalin A-like lectin/glucanase domain superfamily [Septoria linicola]|uniref:Glycoside hydrolase family 16, concanavalin A-like lectin/glucanase domain superfamily n=1 Tax=Septoria linicola TaxID=215465 RepID=A0A9Q9AIX6_9PEZI|nr:Putative glycoside hydrolase family 16, concanavalin A-like lectin/glucanase domain superfamily [Septoria linicola]
MPATFAIVLLALTVPSSAIPYAVQTNFSGPDFFDSFDFWTQYDPTFGFVEYVDRQTAVSLNMLNVTDGVAYFGADSVQTYDPYANKGRKSLRLSTKQTFNHGLFVIDLAHMPSSACGIWPAVWMLGNGPLLWPAYGEIDIVEFTNDARHNLFALHTTPDCTIAGSGQTGTLLTNDCGEDQGYKGCGVSPDIPNSAGTDFNTQGGGAFIVEWTSAAIKIWLFPRTVGIPSQFSLALTPDPDVLGVPTANYQGGCSIDDHFANMQVIFNIDFCGTWAGPTFNTNNSCPVSDPNQWTSCNVYVGSNPQAYKDAYFAVNSLVVYQPVAASAPTTSSVTSVTPAESTTSVTAGGAEGRPTTSSTASQFMAPVPDPEISVAVPSSTNTTTASSSALIGEPGTFVISTQIIILTSIVTIVAPPATKSGNS